MRKVQGAGEGDCLHRGPCGHRQDPQPPQGQGSQTSFSIHPIAATTSSTLASRVGAGTGGLNQHTASTPTDITDDATYTDCRGVCGCRRGLMGEQPARWVHLAQHMDISGFRGVFGGEIGSVTSKHFRLDDNGIPVYIPYPLFLALSLRMPGARSRSSRFACSPCESGRISCSFGLGASMELGLLIE